MGIRFSYLAFRTIGILAVGAVISVLGSCRDELHMGEDQDLEEIVYGDPIELPFYIDEHYSFAASLDLNDSLFSTPCDQEDDLAPEGHCHQIIANPFEVAFNCFYFVFPKYNWGQLPGLPIEQGGIGIRFSAWSNSELVYGYFTAGGIGSNSTNYEDELKVTEDLVITDTPREYTLLFEDAEYDQVIGALSICIEVVGYTEQDVFVMFLDNVEWIDEESEHCSTPGEGCPMNVGWPSACELDECLNGEECGGNGSWDVGLCELPCNVENDDCPDTAWGLTGRCFLESFGSPLEICFATDCEDDSECPEGMLCVGYAACPGLHQCSDDFLEGPDCETIGACGDVPIEGKLCYPDYYTYW